MLMMRTSCAAILRPVRFYISFVLELWSHSLSKTIDLLQKNKNTLFIHTVHWHCFSTTLFIDIVRYRAQPHSEVRFSLVRSPIRVPSKVLGS